MRNIWKILALLGRDSARTMDSLIEKGLFSIQDEKEWNESDCNRDEKGRFASKQGSEADSPKESKAEKKNEAKSETSKSDKQDRNNQTVTGKQNEQQKSEFVGQESGKIKTEKAQIISALLIDNPVINRQDQQKHTDYESANRANMRQFAKKKKEYEKKKQKDPQLKWIKPLPKSYFSRAQEDILKDIKQKVSKQDYKVSVSGDQNERLLVKLDKYSGMVYNKDEFKFEKTKCFEIVLSRKKGIHFYPVRQNRYDQQ